MAGAIHDEREQAARRGLGDDGQVSDNDERVGAEILVRGFDKVQALVINGYGNRFRFPALSEDGEGA